MAKREASTTANDHSKLQNFMLTGRGTLLTSSLYVGPQTNPMGKLFEYNLDIQQKWWRPYKPFYKIRERKNRAKVYSMKPKAC